MESNIGSEDRKTQNDSHLILRLEHEDVIGTAKRLVGGDPSQYEEPSSQRS